MAPFTIPALTRRLSVSATTVRGWIDSGEIEPPPLSGHSVYTSDEAERIEQWYLRCASCCRGPGAKARWERALAVVEGSSEVIKDDDQR